MKTYPFVLILLGLLLTGCPGQETAEPAPTNSEATKEMVFTTDLVDDSVAVARYRQLHSPEGVWPEIVDANRAAGISGVRIYQQGRRLFMIVEVPADAEMDVVDSLYAASHPEKLKAWADLTGSMQEPPPGAGPGQVWVPMERIHFYPPAVE